MNSASIRMLTPRMFEEGCDNWESTRLEAERAQR